MKRIVWLFGLAVVTLLTSRSFAQVLMFRKSSLLRPANRSLTETRAAAGATANGNRVVLGNHFATAPRRRRLSNFRRAVHRKNASRFENTDLHSDKSRSLAELPAFGIFGPNFIQDFQKQFSAFSEMTFKDPLETRQNTRKSRKQPKRIVSLLPNSDLHSKTPVFKHSNIMKNSGLKADIRAMLESKDPPSVPKSDGVVGFKKVSKPTFSLKEEFGSKFEEMFELGFGDSVFDMYLDDLGENDVKLIDKETRSKNKSLRKFECIISDFGGIVNH